MRAHTVILALVLVLAAGAALAQVKPKDMSRLYDRAELATWHYILELQTQENFKILLTEGLDEKDRQKVPNLRLEIPKEGRGLIEFWAQGNTVYVPILSLKFLNDILLANAWLYLRGYDPRTVDEYVAMLKYRDELDFPGGRFPRPLPALGIPHTREGGPIIGSDKKVEEAYFAAAVITSSFIMAHEIAHIVLGHTRRTPNTVEELVRDEQDADAFALRAISRVSPNAELMAMYFTVMAAWSPNRADFEWREDYEAFLRNKASHPVTGERIRALGRAAQNNPEQFLSADARAKPENIPRMQRLGANLVALGNLVDDDARQRLLALRGRIATTDSLKPRPSPEGVPRPRPW